ncbi:MAG TPA: NrsF family protein [Bryobacterales bacterium]|nr:NrsF family protein [Bryobacterales bacterium]
MDAELDHGTSELSMESSRHLDECERCRRLYAWFRQTPAVAEAPPHISASVLRNLPQSIQPVSPRRSTPAIASQLVGLFVLVAILPAILIGLAGLRQMSLLQLITMSIVLVGGLTALALSLGWQSAPGGLQRFSLTAAVGIAALAFLLCSALPFPWHTPEPFYERGWLCLKHGLGLALVSALVFWLLLRRGAPMGRGFGTALGAVSGLAGITMLQLTCDRQEGEHLLFWHGGVLVVATVCGLLIGKLFPRFSAKSA